MRYWIKEKPRVVYESTTRQFIVLDDKTGEEYHIRKWEDTKSAGYYMLNQLGVWVEFHPTEELEDFLGLV